MQLLTPISYATLMLKLPLLLTVLLQVLNELQWELMAAKMSLLKQVEVLQLTMQLQQETTKRCGSNPQRLLGKENTKSNENLQQWADGKGTRAWVPATALLFQATSTEPVAQGHDRGRKGTHLVS